MQKRVAFTTIKDTSEVQPKEALFTESTHLKKDKKSDGKTHRFVLKLPETTNETFPEYSYLDLLKSVEAEVEEAEDDIRTDDDPFGSRDEAEDRKLKEIAKKFEMKYGPKRKSYVEFEDFIDKGMGYDENDPFIDNEEAYDELIPSTLTTKYGGFYINCGQLDFKPLCDEEEDENKDSDEINKPVIKKRKRDIDSQVPGFKRKRLNNGGKLNSLMKAKRDKYPGGTVAQLLKQEKQKQQSLLENPSKGNEVNVFKPTKRNVILDDDDDDEDEVEEIEKDGNDLENRLKLNSGSIDSVIESVVKGGDAVANGSSITITSGNSSDGSEGNVQVNMLQLPKLPDQLPSGLSDALDKIKELRLVNFEGKQKFFKDNDVNKVLLEIEVKCRELPNNIRNQVYVYLGCLLPYTKETLMKRAKKLRLESEENKIHLALASLRDEVAKIMSELQKQYHENYKSAMSSWEKEKQNGRHPSEDPVDTLPNLPKREFRWTDKARSLLKNVVNIKKSLTDQSSINKNQSEDEYLNTFFEAEVKPIWPKGWITTKALVEEYQNTVSQKNKPTEVTVCNKVQTNKTPAISFIKKPQVPQSNAPSLVTTSSTGIVLSSQNRTPLLSTVNSKNDRTLSNKCASNTPVNLSSKETTEARQQSTGNATSKPEGLMCSVDKFITTAISSATVALPKSSKAASPPPSSSSVISSTNAKCSSVVTSQITYVGQSSRSSPNSLLSKSTPSNLSPLVSLGVPSQQRQKQQSQPQQQQPVASQSQQQQPQSQSTPQRTSQKNSKLEVTNLSFTNQALEKIIKNSLGNYPNSNPPNSEKTQTNQRAIKQQQHQQQQLQQQPVSQQQSKHFPGIEYAFEHEICKSLSEGKSNQRQDTKSVQQKQVQQTQQASAVTSRSSPLPPFQRSTSVPSVKASQANTKPTESKPMVTITPIPQQQHQMNRSLSQSASSFASHALPVNNSSSTTQAYTSPHNIAQLLFAQQHPYSYPQFLNNYNMLINASQAAVTTSGTSSSNSQYPSFNLMHHTYAAPPPSGGQFHTFFDQSLN